MTAGSKVPSSYQLETNEAGMERNRWTAVSDLYAIERFVDIGAHHAVFLRVNNRTWFVVPSQTRFACYINRRRRIRQGALQLPGDVPKWARKRDGRARDSSRSRE